jgi:hypothetical protein
MKTMYLNRKDIEKINSVLDQFPDLDRFELNEENCSGIGSIVTMTFSREVNDITGAFTVEIAGVEQW